MHECVLSARRQKKLGVTAMDIAKRLIDLGFYAPTTYFPLIVEEALMIEPTETESKETLDQFCDAMIQIAREAGDRRRGHPPGAADDAGAPARPDAGRPPARPEVAPVPITLSPPGRGQGEGLEGEG